MGRRYISYFWKEESIMTKNKKKNLANTKFPELPEYPGGKTAFKKFISENMRYPAEAVKNNIEGDVFVKFVINDNGSVQDASVLKGIGYGCDEEALRLIKLLRFGGTRNRGFKITTTKKIKIRFSLKNIKKALEYSYTTKPVQNQKNSKAKPSKGTGEVYEYSIEI